MWNKINSPIVITIIAVASLFVLRATMKPKLASEIRGAYEELNAILEDGASDAHKTKAIQTFAQEISTQMRAGFKSDDAKNASETKVYLETKNKIKIDNIKFVKAKWPGREAFIFQIENKSNKYISNVHLNYEFYKNGELIDCKNKWVTAIKILEPNQKIALSEDRRLVPQGTPKEEYDKYKSDEVKISITSFSVKEMR